MTAERRPMIDTEVSIMVDDEWVTVIVIDWEEDPSEWFIVKHEGEFIDLPLANEWDTWKRLSA